MLPLTRQLTQTLFRRPLPPIRQFSQASAFLKPDDKLEEEKLPWYSADRLYPVKIGDVFCARYQVIGKLSYGGYSTVWIGRDLE